MVDKKNSNKNNNSDAMIERPSFDIVFQMGILKLAIQEDYFCMQMVKYLADDKDLEEYVIFESNSLQEVFKLIAGSLKEFGSRPTEGQIRQKFNDEKDEDYKADLHALLDNILDTDTHNEEFYRQYLSTYIQQVKMAKGFTKTKKIWRERPDDAPAFMQSVIDGIRRVTFEKEDVVTMGDLPALISEGSILNSRKIPTGVKELDIDLVGGLPRENLTVILAGTNVGKSLFCISLACNALKAVDENGNDKGFKVLHINLEGMRDEAVKRYAANLAAINYSDLIRGTYDEAGKKRLDDAMTRFDSERLMIRNMLGFGATIEDLVAYCREIYKSFKFDMLVVDYGQLLDSKQKTEGYRFTMSRVFRGLDSISKEFSAVVTTPAQATRNAQEGQQNNAFKGKNSGGDSAAAILRSTDISEAFEIARVSGVILTLNRTENEEKQNRLRLYLEKQRQGAKNKLYGLITNYGQSNLITGKTYNPFEVVIEGEVDLKGADRSANSGNKGLTGTMTSLDNLPKPKAKEMSLSHEIEAIEVKEDKLSDQVKFMDKLYQEYDLIRSEYFRSKDEYDEIRDGDGDYDPDEMDKRIANMDKMKETLKNIEMEARGVLTQAYPNANKDMFELVKNQLNDLKKNSPTSKDIPKIEQVFKHLELGLGLIKQPI